MSGNIHSNPTCPMSDAVRRFARNEASVEEQSLVEAHLDSCAACQATAEEDHAHGDIDADLRKLTLRKESPQRDLTIPVRQLNEALVDYEILEQIGKGGMGVVYKARQIHLGRLVALKVLPSFYGVVRPTLLTQFKTEAGIAARLKHSSIISIYDFGEVDGTLFYAMELIEGRTIADFIQSVRKPRKTRNGRTRSQPSPSIDTAQIDERTVGSTNGGSGIARISRHPEIGRDYFRFVAKWMADVADALAYAHNNNVIHGDIKPANILVTHDDRVMIADFGLAHHRAAIEEDVTKSTLGTLRYMSPEQIDRSRGKPDHRSDVYAIGATLYELLTLRPLVDATQDSDVLLDVLNREPIAPRRLMPQVPRELEIICLKACDKIPSNRYDTATEMAEDLNRWLLDLPILAKRPSIPIRAVKYVRRHRGAVIAGALIIAALISSLAIQRKAKESQRLAMIAAKEARTTAMDNGLAMAIQKLFFEQPDAALRGIRSVAAAYPNELETAILENAILLRTDATAEAEGLLKAARSKNGTPMWLSDLSDLKNASDFVTSDKSLTDMTVGELLHQSVAIKNPQKAIPFIETALAKSPDDILCNVVSCFLYHEVGNYEDMQHSADHIMLLRPNWAIGFGLRGLAVLSMGNYEDANLSLTRAILLQPECARWWNLRSRVNLRFARFAQAEQDAAKSASLAPDLDEAYVNLANAKYKQRDYAGAIAIISQLIDKSEQPWLYVFRSNIHRAAGAIDEQVSDLLVATKLDPTNVETAKLLGDSYLAMLDYDNALREYAHALDINPNDVSLRFKRAFVSELNNDLAFAEREYRQLGAPGSPWADKAYFFQQLIRDPSETPSPKRPASADRPVQTRWNALILSLIDSEIESDELIQAANTPNEISEAHFYIARIMLSDARIDEAVDQLKLCVQEHQITTLEYDFATILLRIWDRDTNARRKLQ